MDTITTVPTYQATIYCGLRESYDGVIHPTKYARQICQEYVDSISLCVTVTITEFIYNEGRERVGIVGLINYPRFPMKPEVIRLRAITLATLLKDAFNQKRVTVVCTDRTFMLGEIE